MSLIKCPVCEKEISDKAIKCVHCGETLDKKGVYCIECGNLIKNNVEECPECGCPITLNNDNFENISEEIFCPNCHSKDIKIQIVAQKEKRGCLAICLYILLAITIVGIPIVILILLARGNKTSNYKYWICQKCGNTFVPNQYNKTNNVSAIILIIIIAILILVFGISNDGLSGSSINYPYVVENNEMVQKDFYNIEEEIFCSNESLKINKVSYKKTVSHYAPSKGNIFVELNVSLVNSDSYDSIFYLSDFDLVTEKGEIISPSVPISNSDLEKNVVISGGVYNGIVRFEIPKSDKEYVIRYGCDTENINIKIIR